jgi:hypothetical protein
MDRGFISVEKDSENDLIFLVFRLFIFIKKYVTINYVLRNNS